YPRALSWGRSSAKFRSADCRKQGKTNEKGTEGSADGHYLRRRPTGLSESRSAGRYGPLARQLKLRRDPPAPRRRPRLQLSQKLVGRLQRRLRSDRQFQVLPGVGV